VVKRPAAAKAQRPRNAGTSGAKPGAPLTIRSAEAALRAKLALHYTSSRRLFRDLDDDKSGSVQPAELRRFVSQKLHIHISPPAFARMMVALDASGDGSVDLAEFLRVYGADVSGGADGQEGALSATLHERVRTPQAYAQNQQRRFSRSDVHLFSAEEADALLATKLAAKGSQLRKVFRQLDEDTGGSVGREEMRTFMEQKFQIRMADGEFGKLMDLVDPSGDGSISFNEFLGRWGQAFHATEAGGAGHMLQGRRNEVQQYMDATGGGAALGLVSLRDARRLLHEKLGTHGTEARKVFRKLDEDKSGHISEAELRQIMSQKFNIATTDADFASLVAELDHDGSGDITIKEFLAAFGEAFHAADGEGGVTDALFTNVNENEAYLAGRAEVDEARAAARKGPTAAEADALFKEKMRTYHQQVRSAFRKVDRDNSQTVEKEEFALVLEGFAITMEAAEFDKLWRMYDHDGNGSINYDEFVANFSDEIQAQERGGIGVLMANSAEERREMGYVGKDYGAGTAGEVTAEAAALVDGELRRLVRRNWKRMKAMFVEADADRNGVLGRGEFRAVLKAMGMELGAAQFNRVWHKFDEDRGGAISYNEFLAACMVDEDQGGARSFRTSTSRGGGGGGGGGGGSKL
jgi:Ca2+-binding EF-hand superfamily protein